MAVILYPPEDADLWPTLGPYVCQFIEENLVYGPGDLLGQPVRLNDEDRGWFYSFYEVEPPFLRAKRGGRLTKQKNPRAGRRRFERCVLSLRKGSSKTERGAWIAACELHQEGPVRCDGFTKRGDPIPRPVTDPYIPMISFSEEQTEELGYGAFRRIIEESALASDFDIGLSRILRKGGDGRAEAVSASPNARDGARTTMQWADEALALDTPLPTPTGWTTMGEVRPGDWLLGSDGQPCRVTGKSPVHEGRPCYRVTFADRTSVVADGGHLWYARRRDGCGHGRGCRCSLVPGWAVRRTDAMREVRCHGRWRDIPWRYAVPTGEPVDLPDVDLPVDPYVLGLWLGDGDTRNATITTADGDLDAVEAACRGAGYRTSRCRVRAGRAALLYVTTPDSRTGYGVPRSLVGRLRGMGLLQNKHVPTVYLRAGTGQRLALLQGLMDSDGHVSPGGNCVFVNTNAALVDAVAELARTLGLVPSVTWRDDGRKASYRRVGKVHFQSDQAMPVFRLPRKRERLRPVRVARKHLRAIVAVEPVESVPVQCVAVDAPDHLYRAGVGMVLTHNTHRLFSDQHRRAWTTMLANLGKRPMADPWALETTTAPEPGGGSIAETTMDMALKLVAKPDPKSRVFFYHREASSHHDLSTDKGLRAAILEASGPYIAKWSDVDRIMARFRDADADAAYAERVWLNRRVQATAKAFDVATWRERVREGYTVKDRAAVSLGFDGGRFDDSTGLVATELATGFQWVLGVWEKPATQQAWEVDAAEVDGIVADAFERYTVTRFYCDPPLWESRIAEWAGRYGDKRVLEWWTNRRKPMASAIKAFRTAMETDELGHDGDARYTQHIGNSCRSYTNLTDEDGSRLWILRKERPDSPHKIDLAMAGILSWEARNDSIAAGIGKTPQYSVTIIGG